MGQHIIKMPDIGEGIAEVEIVEWHVNVGDAVVEDQVLADVMTDKASVEIPSPVAGTVVSLGGNVGDIKAVGSELIVIDTEGAGTAESSAASEATSAAAPGQTAATDVTDTAGTGIDRRTTGVSAATQSADADNTRSTVKVLASPSVRHRARQLDIDLHALADIAGGAPISHGDLDRYLLATLGAGDRVGEGTQPPSMAHRVSPASRLRNAPSQPAPSASGASDNTGITRGAAHSRALEATGRQRGDQRIKVVGLRRQIAQKMQESKREIPHFSYVEEVDITDLERMRQTLNENLADGDTRLTLLPFIVRAMVLAMQRYSNVNAHFNSADGELIQYGAVHMGIATQTDNGLVVPVLHNAHTLDVFDCAAEIVQLTSRTRRGKAQRSELTGSTITLSSLGPLGGIAATPIINHPEVAIVGVNRMVERPVLQNGQWVARKIMNLSSSFDHRVIDGMDAAQFVQEVRRYLEAPALLLSARWG